MNYYNINIHFCLMAEYSTLDSENILMIAFFLVNWERVFPLETEKEFS